MNLLGDKVLVEFIEPPATTPSGLIIIPREAQDQSYTGIVKAIGPLQMEVAVGDKIVFSGFAGVPLHKTDGSKQAVLEGREVLAVFSDDRNRKRVTYALDEELIVNKCNPWEDFNLPDLIYIHYNQQSHTLYCTFEEQQPSQERKHG